MTDAPLAVGDTVTLERRVTQEDIAAFAQVTGDTNPVHLDEAYAAQTRFGGRIAHGMLGIGFISAAIGTKLGEGKVTPIYLSQSVRFSRPVVAGDQVVVSVEVTAYDDAKNRATLATTITNGEGATVTTGEAVVLLDPYPYVADR